MKTQDFFNKIANPFMKIVLRSPLHGLVSTSTMLITFTGRKSGRTFTTPVNYWRQGNVLNVVSMRNRLWWRNLRRGAAVTLRLQGQDIEGWGQVFENDADVAAGLAAHLQLFPNRAKYFGLADQPPAEDIAQAAQTRVLVRIEPSDE